MSTEDHRRGKQRRGRRAGGALAVAATALIALGPGCTGGESAADPHRVVNGVKQLPVAELREWLDDGADFQAIDVRILYDWRRGHLPGAPCIPGRAVMDPATGGLVDGGSALTGPFPDLGARLVFYCSGTECAVSQAVAEAAVRIGYEDAWMLEGGFPAWTEAGHEAAVTVEDFCSVPYFPLEGNVLVDVRPAAQAAAGTIPGAVVVPRDTFLDGAGAPIDGGAAFAAALPADPGLIFVLAGDPDELRAVGRFASGAGFRTVRLLEGTYADWLATACGSAVP
jgi:rhodanese-related sulfurtransferase